MKLTYHTDPGHGWLAVPRALLADLNLLDKVTTYSYQRGGTVYLEEDCDASVLCAALKERGIAYTLAEKHTDRRHWIRSCEHYSRDNPPRAPLQRGDVVELAGVRYILRHSLGQRGWAVDRLSDGMAFRMPVAQAKRAAVIERAQVPA